MDRQSFCVAHIRQMGDEFQGFDELLSRFRAALDSESERLIQQSIEQVAHQTTILIVAHRLSTIAKADQVYVMHKGCVVEAGAFSFLSVKQGGFLNSMLSAQSSVVQNLIIEEAG